MAEVFSNRQEEPNPTESVDALKSKLAGLWGESRKVDKQYAEALDNTPDNHDTLARFRNEMDRVAVEIEALEEQIRDRVSR